MFPGASKFRLTVSKHGNVYMSSENLKKVLFFLFFPLFTLEKSKIFNFFSLLQRF